MEQTTQAQEAGQAPEQVPSEQTQEQDKAEAQQQEAPAGANEAAVSEQGTATTQPETQAEETQEQAVATQSEAVDAPVTQKQQPKRRAQSRGRSRRNLEHTITPKVETIAKLCKHDNDVGSSEVQIGLLTDRILHLTEHLKLHRKDKHTNHGLLKLVSRRKRLLKYLEHKDPASCRELKSTLNLR